MIQPKQTFPAELMLHYAMLFLKWEEQIFNYVKHFHKTFFDANLLKSHLKGLSMSLEFHLEDAVNYSIYIKVSDSRI